MSDPQIEARAGIPGALYQTKSGHRVRVLRIEAEQVILQAPGQEKEIPVPSYYVLIPVAEEAAAPEQETTASPPRATHTVEQLAGFQPAAEARKLFEVNIPLLSTPDLERLSELDTRMFAMDMVGKELQRRAAVNIPAELMTGGENASNARAQAALVALVAPDAVAAAAPSEAPAKPRRVWIMLLRDEMLIEVPGRRPALRIPYEGEGAPVAWYGFRAATPPEGYTGPEPGEESAEDVGVRMLTGALRVALGAEDTADPPIDGWEIRSTMALAISEARLATCEGNTPRGLSSSRDQAAFVKDVSSLTGLAWMGRGAIQPTTRREIERQVRALESLEACATTGELAKWAEDKRAKPMERPGVARRYAYVRAHLEAIEEAVPFLAWCQEEGFSFDLDGQEQDVGAWLDGLGDETPERIRAAGAAAKAVKDRQLADREERTAPTPTLAPSEQLAPLTERIADFVGRSDLIPDWITRETFSERCFQRIAVLVGDPDSDALPLLDRTTDLKILETAAAWLTDSGAWPERLQLIQEQILDVRPASTTPAAPVNLAGAPLSEQLATCSAARALELLAGATYERDREEVWKGWGLSTSTRVKAACEKWLDENRPAAVREAIALDQAADEAARLAEIQARASVALGQFSPWLLKIEQVPLEGGPEWVWGVIAKTPAGARRVGHGETLEGAAAELRLMLEREFLTPPTPAPVEKHAEPEQPDASEEPIVLDRVILLKFPDGREDVWYDSPARGKVLLGEARRPDLKAIAQAARQRDAQAAIAARQQEAAKMTSAAVQAAQQTLAALAVGLPALAQLGIEVDIRITTRRPDPVGAKS